MTLLKDLSHLTPDQLSRLLGSMDEGTAAGVLSAFHDEIRVRCNTDGLFWLRFARTRDEADPENSTKSFPVHFPYVREIWGELTTYNKIVIAKSRQMMVSWILCAFCCWWARTKPNQAIYFQSQKDEDANAMVALPGQIYGRCQFIESNLPGFLRQACKATEGKLTYPNGSFIQALAGGADQVRGKVASLIVEDEFAFQPEARGVYTAASPLIQKGAKFIAVSTPNGAEGMFAHLFFGTEQRNYIPA